MNRFKVGGALICLGCIVLAGLFIWGLTEEEWRLWTIAAPVIVAFLGALGIGFSIGRLMSSTEKAPKTQTKEKSAASSTS
jgi:formate hydrogenlyase subunit 3/multisubunit Na+/H+ antiporter MnhD subunit